MKNFPKKYYHRDISKVFAFANRKNRISTWSLSKMFLGNDGIMQFVDAIINQNFLRCMKDDTFNFFCILDDVGSKYNVKGKHTKNINKIYDDVKIKLDQMSKLALLDSNSDVLVGHDPDFRMSMKDVFYRLSESGLLKKDKVCYFWDLVNVNSVNDADVSYVPVPKNVYNIKYFIDSKKETVSVETHSPHTIFADVAIAVNPQDKRYKKFVGKNVIVPIINKVIPVIADETIDIYDGTGAKRIFPCHDMHSYEIAKRHNLPLDIYAYDKKGTFTENATVFAGKKAADFFDNIVQYLSDIHNLNSVEKKLINLPFCKKTNSYLEYLIDDGLSLNTDILFNGFRDFLSSDACNVDNDLKDKMICDFENRDAICISSSHGLLAISDGIGISLSDGYSILDVMIYDLYQDGFINDVFSVDDVVDLLFKDLYGEKTLLNSYMIFFYNKYKDNKKILKDLLDFEKVFKNLLEGNKLSGLDFLVDLLDGCKILNEFGINYKIKDEYVGDSIFIDTRYVLSCVKHKLTDGLDEQNLRYLVYNDESDLSFDSLFFQFVIENLGILGKKTMYAFVNIKDKYDNTNGDVIRFLSENIDMYSIDTLRWSMMTDNIKDIQSSELIIQKIRNVCRYVYMNVDKKIFVTKDFIKFVIENKEQLTEFDSWILYRFSEIYNKLGRMDDILSLKYRFSLIQEYIIEDFSIKYVEIMKQRKGAISDIVMILCVGFILDICKYIAPGMTAELKEQGFEFVDDMDFSLLNDFDKRDYRTHILMMIIGGFKSMKSNLGIKNHQLVDVFVRASTDVISLVKDNFDLLNNIIKISEIEYIAMEKDYPEGYNIKDIIDMTIGLKVCKNKSLDKNAIYALLKEKTEYIQHLRSIMSVSNNPENVLKIQRLKKEIEELQLRIHGIGIL